MRIHSLSIAICLSIVVVLFITGCTHPIEIEGQGDVVSSSGNRDCSPEQQPCNNLIVGDYQETYSAVAREGHEFAGWEGCTPTDENNCEFNVEAATVQQFWGQTAPPIRALFNEQTNDGPVTADILASRTECVSPCTVVFSAEGTVDEQRNHEDAWQDLGYHFDFDDPDSGNYTTTGLSRARQIGGPLAAHTFICEGHQTCSFEVGVRAQNPEGHHSDDFVTVTVDPASLAFTAENTVCVSSQQSFEDCPAGATQTTSLPSPTEYNGQRVLLRTGETFLPICIDYSAANVLIEPFGNPDDGRPELTGTSAIGVDARCGRHLTTDVQIGAIDGSTGYPEKWASNITLNGLRIPYIAYGMSYHHVGMHDINMEYEHDPSGGAIALVQNTNACLRRDELTCANIPYPVGAYMSQVDIIQSDQDIIDDTAPFGVNIGVFNCPIVNWLTVLESTARNSVEHNYRSEGTWRSFHGHSVMAGHHHRDDPLNGVRQKITVRACGTAVIDPSDTIYRHSTVDEELGPMTRYAVIADNILGSTDDFGFGARITMAPTTATSVEVVSFGIAERNTFLEPLEPIPGLATDDGRLSGYNLACRDNIEATPDVRHGCIDAGQNAVPAQWYQPGALDDTVPTPPAAPLGL